METFTDSEGFEWGWCDLCMCAFVFCKNCGNNCCNGGSGDPRIGKVCPDECNAAYKHQSEFFFRPNKYDFE